MRKERGGERAGKKGWAGRGGEDGRTTPPVRGETPAMMITFTDRIVPLDL